MVEESESWSVVYLKPPFAVLYSLLAAFVLLQRRSFLSGRTCSRTSKRTRCLTYSKILWTKTRSIHLDDLLRLPLLCRVVFIHFRRVSGSRGTTDPRRGKIASSRGARARSRAARMGPSVVGSRAMWLRRSTIARREERMRRSIGSSCVASSRSSQDTGYVSPGLICSDSVPAVADHDQVFYSIRSMQMEVFSAEHRRKLFGRSIFHTRIGNLLNVPLLGIPLIYLSRVEQICKSSCTSSYPGLEAYALLSRSDRRRRRRVPERVVARVHRGARDGGQSHVQIFRWKEVN